MPDSREMTGFHAVITGASSGIGEAIALVLASAGVHCFLQWRRNHAGVDRVAAAVRKAGVLCETCQCDFADSRQHLSLVEAAWHWSGGGVNIWVNNAGVDVLTGEAARWTFDEKLASLLAVDVTTTMQLTRLVGARMKAQAGGAIVNIGWDQAETGMAGDSGELFAATKGAIMAFTRSAARSLAPEVRVNCVAPGWIKTSWGETASEYWQQRARREALLDRWGTPEDVARAVCFLASPQSAFITGHILPVNGGLKMH